MIAWIMTLIGLCAPVEAQRAELVHPVFLQIALAIDQAAHEAPLYRSADGVERTVAELVAVSAREGRFNPEARGTDQFGDSWGLGQVHESNLLRLGVSRAEMLSPLANLRAVVFLLAESHRVCAGHPPPEQLALYASGRGHCAEPAGLAASRNRMALAARLLAHPAPRWTEPTLHLAKHAPALVCAANWTASPREE